MKQIERNTLRTNTQEIKKDPVAVSSGVLGFMIVMYLGYIYLDVGNTIGNFGKIFFYTQYITHILLAIVFGLFIAATVYKIRYFRTITPNKVTTAGGAGGIISAILIGCPACSITIASYLGLSTIITNLPGFGLEIKILGLLVLVRATYRTITTLHICNFSINKKTLSQ